MLFVEKKGPRVRAFFRARTGDLLGAIYACGFARSPSFVVRLNERDLGQAGAPPFALLRRCYLTKT